MTADDRMILVVNHGIPAARNLKELIEFMDTPNVRIAAPDDWRSKLGEHRLEALFVGPDVSDQEVDRLLGDIGEMDPNVPIVMMNEDGEE